LVDRLICQGLRHAQRHHAAPSSHRDGPAKIRMKKAQCHTAQMSLTFHDYDLRNRLDHSTRSGQTAVPAWRFVSVAGQRQVQGLRCAWQDRAVSAGLDLVWPTEVSDVLADQSHALIRAVAELRAAIGWLSPPSRAETDEWLERVVAAVAVGDGAICTVWRDGLLIAMGVWRRDEAIYFRHLAELAKIMVHPRARGERLGRVVTGALIDSASRAGIETLHLGVRGNNHLAIELYEELGFREWGRLPNVIEAGNERFDDVRMFLKLNQPRHLILRGSPHCGPGFSPPRRRPVL
jgi:ribosomal protein S18 acetylase RimI-like enzyme